MVAAYHLIWTAYGWWLPNDPRGSTSHTIRVEKIAELGEHHYGREQIQPPRAVLQQFHEEARELLKHPYLELSEEERLTVANAVADTIRTAQYTCYACAIMPEHIHMLIRKHRDYAETMIDKLQKASRQALIDHGKRSPTHPVWGGPGWKVFLNTQADIWRIVRYIEANPAKSGLPPQRWGFVTEYDGWLPMGQGRKQGRSKRET
jgi:REP-associated tyrosine transposase